MLQCDANIWRLNAFRISGDGIRYVHLETKNDAYIQVYKVVSEVYASFVLQRIVSER